MKKLIHKLIESKTIYPVAFVLFIAFLAGRYSFLNKDSTTFYAMIGFILIALILIGGDVYDLIKKKK